MVPVMTAATVSAGICTLPENEKSPKKIDFVEHGLSQQEIDQFWSQSLLLSLSIINSIKKILCYFDSKRDFGRLSQQTKILGNSKLRKEEVVKRPKEFLRNKKKRNVLLRSEGFLVFPGLLAQVKIASFKKKKLIFLLSSFKKQFTIGLFSRMSKDGCLSLSNV